MAREEDAHAEHTRVRRAELGGRERRRDPKLKSERSRSYRQAHEHLPSVADDDRAGRPELADTHDSGPAPKGPDHHLDASWWRASDPEPREQNRQARHRGA